MSKTFTFKVNGKNLAIGLLSFLMFSLGLYLFLSVIAGKITWTENVRFNRGLYIILAWILIAGSFVVVAPNKNGLTLALPVFIGLYLSCAFYTGSMIIFDASATDWIEIAYAARILVPVAFFVCILVMLIYNYASGQEFFKTIIFGGTAIAFLLIGIYTGILPTA